MDRSFGIGRSFCAAFLVFGFIITTSPAAPEPLGDKKLILSEKGLGILKFGKDATFTPEDLLKGYPDHRVRLFHTDGLILAMITTLESYDGKELFSIFTYGDDKGRQWKHERAIDAICVMSPEITDNQGGKVGMTYQEIASLTDQKPVIVRGEGGWAYLKLGKFHYELSIPKDRAPDQPDGQTEEEILSGACKVRAIYWPEVPW